MIMYSQWLRQPINVRHAIAKEFGIAKTLPTHVQDNLIVQDGYKVEDVENALSDERMQEFTGSASTDSAVLFSAVVEKVNPAPIVEEVPAVVETPVVTPTEPVTEKKEAKKAVKKTKK